MISEKNDASRSQNVTNVTHKKEKVLRLDFLKNNQHNIADVSLKYIFSYQLLDMYFLLRH